MKIKTTNFFRHKPYLFSFALLIAAGVFSSLPAYSQVDYSYGINKKGFRLDLGVGVSSLQSSWSSTSLGPAGSLGLDYDLSQFFSIGIQGQAGQLGGTDAENKLYFKKTSVIYYSGTIGLKVAVGQFSNFEASNAFQDALKRIYIGVGAGEVYSSVTLTPHTDGKGLTSIGTGKTITPLTQHSDGTYVGSEAFTEIPVNFGINIALRGFGGNDKFELNPNFQYNFVQSPLFDGYQPSSVAEPSSHIKANGNQAFAVVSIALRLKF